MIAFGTAITKPEVFRRCAKPGIELAAEPDSVVYDLPSIGSIFQSYNAVIDKAAERDDLEALVLVHQDAEIVDAEFCRKVRETLEDPDVGLIGCVGAIGVRSIAWWEGSVATASFLHRYEEEGGGELPAFSWAWSDAPPYARTGEVDTLDGFLLVLSPWTVQNVRFDESLGQLHGYDFDFCLQVRRAGRKVVTADFRAIHTHPLEPFNEPEGWVTAHVKVAEKWDGRLPGVGTAAGSWEQRARRAEAEHDAAILIEYSKALDTQARKRVIEDALSASTESISWRVTKPLRRLNGAAPGREGRAHRLRELMHNVRAAAGRNH
jgi:hypothetical protein